ncbi:H-NS family nucleoid-associated regulatory protein [Azonexus sp. IMCC34842]|uniref:H-NS histone family protein n=1 Tax=Azonexus sp. IMCC34842 TaxID=3420950 RepID=UPI003D0EA402
MATYAEIQAQIVELQAQAEKARKEELTSAIAQVKALMDQHGITIEDLQGVTKKSRKTSPIKAKYRDPVSGNEWTGRGRSPKWLEGKNKDDFAV